MHPASKRENLIKCGIGRDHWIFSLMRLKVRRLINIIKSWPLNPQWSAQILLLHHIKENRHIVAFVESSFDTFECNTCKGSPSSPLNLDYYNSLNG